MIYSTKIQRILILIMLKFLLASMACAANIKLHSITPLAAFNMAFDLKENQQLNSVNGAGAGATIRFSLGQKWNFLFTSGYFNLKVNQNNPIDYWNWEFWNRFYGNYIRDLQRDSNYVAQLSYRQHLHLIPFIVQLEFSQPIGERFTVQVAFGGGIFYFKRVLTVHEKWTKYFPEKDYRFTYAFDNHANPHSGTIPACNLALQTNYRLRANLNLNAGVQWGYFFKTGTKQFFPFRQLVQFQLGFQFLH